MGRLQNDDHGITHWDIIYKKSPLILTFYKDTAVLEIPKLDNIIEAAPIVHQHGTFLVERKTTKFVYDYTISEKDSTIYMNGGFLNNIELKYKNGHIYWPLWKIKDSMTVFTKKTI